jgi:hypothetical protein
MKRDKDEYTGLEIAVSEGLAKANKRATVVRMRTRG